MKKLNCVRIGMRLGCLISLGSALSLSAQTTLLSDNFADAERLNQSLPTSAHWYTNGSPTVSAGGLTGVPPQTYLANFTSGTGASQSLGVGDTLTFNFTFSVAGAIDSDASQNPGFVRGFRVGVLNSNGATFGNVGIYDASYNAFTGYFAALNLKVSDAVNDAAPISLLKRSSTSGTVLTAPATTGTSFLILNNAFTELGANGTSTNPYSTLGSAGGTKSTANQFIDGTTYSGTFTLLRDTANSMQLSMNVNGGVLSGYSTTVSDALGIFSAFNVIAIGPTTGDVTNFTLQSASVVYTAVPEPSACVVLFGLVAMGAWASRWAKLL